MRKELLELAAKRVGGLSNLDKEAFKMCGSKFTLVRDGAFLEIPLGVLTPLVRTPAVFERQTKWNLEPDDGQEEWVLDRKNYQSAEEHKEHLRNHLEAEVADGLMEKLTEEEFVRRFGQDRAIASLAVLVEDAVTGKKRVVHDATHGIGGNNRIRCVDKVRMPSAREKRRLLEEYKSEGAVVIVSRG